MRKIADSALLGLSALLLSACSSIQTTPPMGQACPCPKEFYCNLTTSTCASGCAADSDCNTGATCNTSTRQCSDNTTPSLCKSDADCLAGSQTCDLASSQCKFPTGPTKMVDVLFVMDNSPGMAAKQKQLAIGLPNFIAQLDAASFNYHIGFTTTDVGTLTAPGVMFPGTPLISCSTFAGDDGALQATPCTNISGLTGEAISNCATLCPDPKYVPNAGMRYIAKESGVTNVPSLMSGGRDIGPALAAQCLALRGDVGCGVESPLEAAKRALDSHAATNSGFLRTGSLLAVIFLTDEDDCSVQLTRRNENDPMTVDCASPDNSAAFGCFNLDYRCFARAVTCSENGGAMNVTGTKTNCVERPNNYLEPIATYTKFFTTLRPANRLFIQGIWSPSIQDNPTGDTTKNGRVIIVNQSPPSSSGLNRGIQGQAACYNSLPGLTNDPSGYSGKAQLRLTQFVRNFPISSRLESDICAAPYTAPLAIVASMLATLSVN